MKIKMTLRPEWEDSHTKSKSFMESVCLPSLKLMKVEVVSYTATELVLSGLTEPQLALIHEFMDEFYTIEKIQEFSFSV